MGQHEGGGARLLRLIAVAAMTLMVDSSPAPAQQAGAGATEELDAGRFEILVDGRPVGTEVFAIRRVGTKVRSVGRLQVENGEEAWWPFEVRLQTNADLEPEIYELKFMAGPIQTVVGRRTENGLLIHTATDEGERYKEFGTEAGTIILEHGTAHHFVLMFRRLKVDAAGALSGTVAVIVPSRNAATTARVGRIDESTRTIAGRDIRVTRYDVQLDSEQLDSQRAEVWVGPEGRVLRVSIPDTGWQATRTEGESDGG